MALELKDRIWTLCTNTGTSDIIVGEPKEGYQNWANITLGATVYYTIVDDVNWEVGYGQYLDRAGTKQITRNLLSSSSGDKIELSGNGSVFLTYPSEKAVILNVDGNIQLPNANTKFKNITSDQVTSPVVITEAVIVDGTAGTEGDLAKLLDVYTKDEIKDIEEAQNKEIAETYLSKVDGGTIKDSVVIDEPTQDADYSAFTLMGRIDGTNGRTLLKDFHYSRTSPEENDAIQYFGTQISDSSIMNKGQIAELVDGEIAEAVKAFKERRSLYIKEATRRTDGGIDDNQFVTNSDFQATTTEFYFKNAYTSARSRKDVSNYESTGSAKVTIYSADDGIKVYMGLIESIVAEDGNAVVTTNPLFVQPSYAWSFSSKAYAIIIEDVVEKSSTLRDTLKQTKEVK